MQRYSEYSPTQFDIRGLGCDDRQDWLVLGLIRTRDSGPLDESNFASALRILGDESETLEVHRFGHWGPGWFEIILLHPSRQGEGEEIERRLENYPVLDDDDFSEREYEAANDIWRDCYRPHDRLAYIRKHRSQFEFRDFADLMGCVRGEYFTGYASELVQS